jgi:hypothetical protein
MESNVDRDERLMDTPIELEVEELEDRLTPGGIYYPPTPV